MDRISVIVPIYDLAAYLYQCVQSLVEQTYRNLEIILVDDGSTDAALEICEFFRKADSRVQVIAKPNGGLVSARKAGLAHASGDYAFYVDGDDWLDAGCLEAYHDLARRHDVDMVIGGHKREFLGNFSYAHNALPTGLYPALRMQEQVLPAMIQAGDFFQHGIRTYSWGKLYRRSLIDALQQRVPDEITFGEDAALVYPAILAAKSIYLSDLTLYNYRHRPNSILQAKGFTHAEATRMSRGFGYMAQALGARQDTRYAFLRQLQAYLCALLIIRHGAYLGDPLRYRDYQPFGELEPGSRIALYNSGSFGQHVYRQLRDNPELRCVGWFDRDFRENRLLKMDVEDPSALAGTDFDWLVLASFDPAVHAEVAALFVRHGLPQDRIRRVVPPRMGFASFIESNGFDPITFLPRGPRS